MSGTKQSSNQVLDLAVNIAAETDGLSLGSGAGTMVCDVPLWHRGHILAPWFPSGLIFVGQPTVKGVINGGARAGRREIPRTYDW